MMKDILPFDIIARIDSYGLAAAEKFRRESPTCHLTVQVEGCPAEHIICDTSSKPIPLTPDHSFCGQSHGAEGGGIYSINDGRPISVKNGESKVLGLYLKDEDKINPVYSGEQKYEMPYN